MKIAFAGTPPFAATVLGGLLNDDRFEVAMVISQPARKKGRGQKTAPTAVADLAESRGLTLMTPEHWDESVSEAIRAGRIEFMITAAYGLILPRHGIDAPLRTSLNIHASLLPRWRGAAPIQRAIEAGDKETGVSIFLLEESLDTGPIASRESTSIRPDDTSVSLERRLAEISSSLLPRTLLSLGAGEIVPAEQSESGVTYARKIRKSEGILDWTRPANEICSKYRAFQPWPGVSIGGLALTAVAVRPESAAAGTVIAVDPLVIAASEGSVELVRVRPEGKREMDGSAYARGKRLQIGDSILP